MGPWYHDLMGATLRLPEPMNERLRREAYLRHVSQAQIIQEALEYHLTVAESKRNAPNLLDAETGSYEGLEVGP